MDKKPKRTKKPLNVDLKIGKTDVHIERDANGNVDVDVDSKNVDVHFSKDEHGVDLEIEIDDKQIYQFVSNGSNKHLKAGAIVKITGQMVKYFIKRGFGNLKK
jgi:predicted PilT family ATPase